jgi:hypothetical protein
VLRLTAEGYAVGWVRGAGVRHETWQAVESVQTVRLGADRALCVTLAGGRRSVVPLALLGSRQVEATREVHDRLTTAHGDRRRRP